MLNIAVCDDEDIQIRNISKLIKENLNFINKEYNICEFNKGEDLLSSIIKFDIYFLDIQMNNISGIDAAKKIRLADENAIIIFTTAFKDYVFDAFDVQAFHYILKPIDKNKFDRILHSAIESLMGKDKFIVAKTISCSFKIYLKDIIYIESLKRKIRIHTTYSIIEYYYKISELEIELVKDNFFRCHKSYIVNLKYVQSFDNNSIILKNFEQIYISKYKLSEFSKVFMYYLKNEEYYNG